MAIIGPGGRRAPARSGGSSSDDEQAEEEQADEPSSGSNAAQRALERGAFGRDRSTGSSSSSESSSSSSRMSNRERRRRNFQRLRQESSSSGSSPSVSEEAESALDRGALGRDRSGSSGGSSSSTTSGRSDESGGGFGFLDDVPSVSGVGSGIASGTEEVVDESASGVQDFLGVEEFRRRPETREKRREFEQSGPIGQFTTATEAGFDFFLDNPTASVQETTVDAIGAATGAESDEEVAEQFQSVDQGVTQTIDDTIEGTPVDNPATDVVRTGTDILIGDTIRTFVKAGTGINTEEGTTEADVGALDAFDIALTATTAGGGKAAASALRGADELPAVGRALRGGDDLFSLGARSSDDAGDAGRLADEAADASRGADEATVADSGRGADEALLPVVRRGDEVADAGRGVEGATDASRGVDETGGLVDNVIERAGRARNRAVETGRLAGRITSRAGRRALRGGAAAGRGATRLAGQAARSRPGRLAALGTAGGAGLVAGGTLVESLTTGTRNRVEAGNAVFTIVDNFQPTDRFNGGTLYEVRRGETRLGYSVVLGVEDGDLRMLGSNGEPTTAPLTPAQFEGRESGGDAAGMAVFNQEQAARDAYFGGDAAGSNTAGAKQWGRLETVEELAGGWVLSRQEATDGTTRYFVLRPSRTADQIKLLTSGGGVETVEASTPLSELSSFESADAARSVHQKWLEEQEKNGEQPEREWTEWEEIDSAPPWYVYGRSHVNGDRQQFVISGLRAGSRVYLAPEGEIIEEPHIFERIDAATEALSAYFERTESGEVAEADRPTGGRPSPGGVGEDVANQSDEEDGEAAGVIGWLMDNPLVTVSLVIVVVLVIQSQRSNLPVPELSASSGSGATGGA